MEIFKPLGDVYRMNIPKKLKRVISSCLENRKGYPISKCKDNKDGKTAVCRSFL